MSDKPTCAHCKEELGSKYYQDVPREGDLCLECHTKWLVDMQRMVHEQARAEPVGGPMPEFIVVKRKVIRQFVTVSAPSPRIAVDIVNRGGGEIGDEEYDYDMETSMWDVTDIDGNLIDEKEWA